MFIKTPVLRPCAVKVLDCDLLGCDSTCTFCSPFYLSFSFLSCNVNLISCGYIVTAFFTEVEADKEFWSAL